MRIVSLATEQNASLNKFKMNFMQFYLSFYIQLNVFKPEKKCISTIKHLNETCVNSFSYKTQIYAIF